jgi:O-antigen/teichoic acid export membrane protein
MLGEKWTPVIPVLRVLAVVGVFQSVQTTVGQIYIAKGRTDLMFYVGSINTLAAVAGFIVGVRYGVIGVAVAYAVAYFTVQLFLSLIPAFRLIGLPFRVFAWKFLPQLAITIAMGVTCLLWMRLLVAISFHAPLLHLVSSVAIGAAAYVLLLLRLRPPAIGFLEEILGQEPDSRLALLVSRVTSMFSPKA